MDYAPHPLSHSGMVRRKCTTAPGHRWIGPWGQWNSNQNVKGFIQQNAFENVWTDAVPDLRRYMTLLGHTGLMPHLWNLCELSLIQPLNSMDTFAPACIFFKPDCMFWVKYITLYKSIQMCFRIKPYISTVSLFPVLFISPYSLCCSIYSIIIAIFSFLTASMASRVKPAIVDTTPHVQVFRDCRRSQFLLQGFTHVYTCADWELYHALGYICLFVFPMLSGNMVLDDNEWVVKQSIRVFAAYLK